MRFSYKQVNNFCGFLCFGIAAIVYCLTIEPTASFWDCGKFIISGYKLEVGHPPGAPFFILTANLFTQLTNDPELVAKMVNYMSALISAVTIMLLFFTITRLVRKLLLFSEEITSYTSTLLIMSCGFIGSMVYTFSDTFWFSAVEAEVYAYSSLFTALVLLLEFCWSSK